MKISKDIKVRRKFIINFFTVPLILLVAVIFAYFSLVIVSSDKGIELPIGWQVAQGVPSDYVDVAPSPEFCSVSAEPRNCAVPCNGGDLPIGSPFTFKRATVNPEVSLDCSMETDVNNLALVLDFIFILVLLLLCSVPIIRYGRNSLKRFS